MRKLIVALGLLLVWLVALPTIGRAQDQPRNVVLILSDDHRYDFMGFHENAPAFLETPNFDRMAREGAHLMSAFVVTSLCSPSRASILTGQYTHHHGVVDNQHLVPEGTTFFPEHLQDAGYTTAFVGKWHMGASSAEPRPGFDHWVSFRGQGVYFDPTLNVDGETVERGGYISEILTEYALDWLETRTEVSDRPFFLLLSHKAVHHPFRPAPQDSGRYAGAEIPYPPTYWNTAQNNRGLPQWVKEQRYSWHGVAYPFYNEIGDFEDIYRHYAETVLSIDRSIGRVLDYLEESGLAENTLVIYLSDNGFSLGEHGLLDKRQAYRESIRIPMLAWAPGVIEPGTKVSEMVMNIDIAPTVLALAGTQVPADMDGASFLPLLRGERVEDWRNEILYQYYWEYNFPQTPTTYALLTDRYKYILYHGVWSANELFDRKNDPDEQRNLALNPDYRDVVQQMHDRLFELLKAEGAVDVAFRKPPLWQLDRRLLPEGN